MMSFLISAHVSNQTPALHTLTGPNKKARMAALLLPQQQSAQKRLHKSNSVCLCVCVHALYVRARVRVCLSASDR